MTSSYGRVSVAVVAAPPSPGVTYTVTTPDPHSIITPERVGVGLAVILLTYVVIAAVRHLPKSVIVIITILALIGVGVLTVNPHFAGHHR